MRGQDSIVRLDDRVGHLGTGINGELQLGLFAVVLRQPLEQQGTETGSCSTTEGMEDEESLQARAGIGQASQSVENGVDQLFADGVVTTSVVVGGVFLAGDERLRMEERSVGSRADLIDDSGLKIDVDGSRYVFSLEGLPARRAKKTTREEKSRGEKKGWRMALAFDADRGSERRMTA